MSHLQFPERATVAVLQIKRGATAPYDGPQLAFSVRTFARTKNDYRLGPFFSGDQGILTITRRQCELHVAATLDSGLMDYAAISEAFSLVEIVHWSTDELRRALEARSSVWTSLLAGEAELFGSVESLKARLLSAGNSLVRPPFDSCGRLRDEWDGRKAEPQYNYTVSREAAAAQQVDAPDERRVTRD